MFHVNRSLSVLCLRYGSHRILDWRPFPRRRSASWPAETDMLFGLLKPPYSHFPVRAGSGPLIVSRGSLFVLGPPSGAQSEFGAPPWAALWTSCCSPPRSGDPLGAFQKSFKAKNKNLKISPVFPSKIEPWRTFADPGPPKKAPHGPDRFLGGPPRRLQGRSPENTKAPGRPLGRQILVSEPSLANPRNCKDENDKKTSFFRKSLECLFL